HGEVPLVCLPLRQDRLTLVMPGVTPAEFPSGDGLTSLGGPLPRLLLLTLLVSCRTRFGLRHQSQQMVPAKPDPR
ncbi:MAG: hypothetical protein ACK559_40295, partial [bacterium]